MIIQVEPLHLFWFAIIGISLLGASAAIGRWLILQAQQKTDAQVELIKDDTERWNARWHAVESQVTELRIQLPERYVRREDYVRGQTVIENKIDRVFLELENMRLQGAINGGKG